MCVCVCIYIYICVCVCVCVGVCVCARAVCVPTDQRPVNLNDISVVVSTGSGRDMANCVIITGSFMVICDKADQQRRLTVSKELHPASGLDPP